MTTPATTPPSTLPRGQPLPPGKYIFQNVPGKDRLVRISSNEHRSTPQANYGGASYRRTPSSPERGRLSTFPMAGQEERKEAPQGRTEEKATPASLFNHANHFLGYASEDSPFQTQGREKTQTQDQSAESAPASPFPARKKSKTGQEPEQECEQGHPGCTNCWGSLIPDSTVKYPSPSLDLWEMNPPIPEEWLFNVPFTQLEDEGILNCDPLPPPGEFADYTDAEMERMCAMFS